MEDLSVTVRTISAIGSGSAKPTVVTPLASKSTGSELKLVNTAAGGSASLDLQNPSAEDVSTDEVKEAVNNLNSLLESSARSIRFQIDDTTNKIKVFVVDEETGEVVRRIPPEASIRLVANGELSGLFTIQG